MKPNKLNIALAILVALGISACKSTTPPGELKTMAINPTKPESDNSGNPDTASSGTDSPSNPNKPPETPTTPAGKPDTPPENPSQPSDKPDTPPSAPNIPSDTPSSPSDKPDAPPSIPSTPPDAPSTPTNEPTIPPVDPSSPPDSPNAPSGTPNTPPTKPDPTDGTDSTVTINLGNKVDGSTALQHVKDKEKEGNTLPTKNVRPAETETVLAGYRQNYTTYAVIRGEGNKNPNNHVIEIDPGKHTNTSYKEQLAKLDATYTGKLSISYANTGTSDNSPVYDADIKLQLKDNAISGTATNDTYGISYVFNNAPIAEKDNALKFSGTFMDKERKAGRPFSSGTYEGAFAGEKAEEVIGRLDGKANSNSITGAFAATDRKSVV